MKESCNERFNYAVKDVLPAAEPFAEEWKWKDLSLERDLQVKIQCLSKSDLSRCGIGFLY